MTVANLLRISFFTLVSSPLILAAQCCDHVLVMNDSYGDGWNGGHLVVYVNGNYIGQFAAEEAGSSEVFEVCDGDIITMEYFSGDYENENTWFLLGSGGGILDSDGPTPQVGFTEAVSVDCSQMPPAGSSPCVAITIEEWGCQLADNTVAQSSGYQPWCANYQGGDIWYEATIPESGALFLQTQGGGNMNDTGIALWVGEACFDLEQVACDDDSGGGYFSLIAAYDMEPGQTVYVQLWGWAGQMGTFNFCVSDPGTIEIDSSPLPLLFIDTNGENIPNEPKIDANLAVVYNGVGATNYVDGLPTDYNGNIGIEIRGASSSGYPQKPYGFETRDEAGNNNNVSLVDMPSENDWILLSNYNDKTFMRNSLAQDLFTKMGNYGPRQKLCEVFLNESYQGIYVLSEKIKKDNDRVDIATLGPLENSGDEVTGGYILELNYWNNNNSWELNYHPLDHPDFDVHLVYRYPKPDVITDEQKDYIANFVDSMEVALYGDQFADPVTGYRQYLDIESFIDYFLLNEVSRNHDGFKKSRFFFKDKASNGGKLKAGPTWDFDWAWKNLYACSETENVTGEGWAYLINNCPTDNYSPDWYVRLFQDTTFANHMRCRYEEYRYDFLNSNYLHAYIDSVAALVEEPAGRHYQKWPFLGISTGAPDIGPIPDSYQGEVDFLKDWIDLRLLWLDDNIPGNCWGPITTVESGELSEVRCFPNPSSGEITISIPNGISRLVIIDAQGRMIRDEPISNNPAWNGKITSSGVYTYLLIGERATYSGKFVVVD
jgi:hypothetical protein